MTERKEQFTPGPWNCKNSIYVNGPNGLKECGTWIDYDGRDDSDNVIGMVFCSANAHLIAAAPELYEALKELIAVLCHDGRDLSQEICTKMHDAESALAKARGEQ